MNNTSQIPNIDPYALNITFMKDGKKRWKCMICEKTFSFRCNLKRHHNKHAGRLHFPCEHCLKRFSRSDDLKVHLKHCKKMPKLAVPTSIPTNSTATRSTTCKTMIKNEVESFTDFDIKNFNEEFDSLVQNFIDPLEDYLFCSSPRMVLDDDNIVVDGG